MNLTYLATIAALFGVTFAKIKSGDPCNRNGGGEQSCESGLCIAKENQQMGTCK